MPPNTAAVNESVARMSNSYNMQRLSAISAGAALALLAIAVFVALRDETSLSPSVSPVRVVPPKPAHEYIGDFPPFWGERARISEPMSRVRALLPPPEKQGM